MLTMFFTFATLTPSRKLRWMVLLVILVFKQSEDYNSSLRRVLGDPIILMRFEEFRTRRLGS